MKRILCALVLVVAGISFCLAASPSARIDHVEFTGNMTLDGNDGFELLLGCDIENMVGKSIDVSVTATDAQGNTLAYADGEPMIAFDSFVIENSGTDALGVFIPQKMLEACKGDWHAKVELYNNEDNTLLAESGLMTFYEAEIQNLLSGKFNE